MSNKTKDIVQRYGIPESHEMDFLTLYNTFRDEPAELWDKLDGPAIPLSEFDVSQTFLHDQGRTEINATYLVVNRAGTFLLTLKDAKEKQLWSVF